LIYDTNDKELEMRWNRNGSFLVSNSALLFIVDFIEQSNIFAIIVSVLGLLASLIWVNSARNSYAWTTYWTKELRRLEQEIPDCDSWTRVASIKARESKVDRVCGSTRIHFI